MEAPEPLKLRRILVPVDESRSSVNSLIGGGDRGPRIGVYRSMFMGSVSQRVIKDAKVPVVIVPRHLGRAEGTEA